MSFVLFNDPGLNKDILCDHILFQFASHQIGHQAISKVGTRHGDCRSPLYFSQGSECMYMGKHTH